MSPILCKIIVCVIVSASGEKKSLSTEESKIKKKKKPTEWRHWQIITTLGRQWQVLSLRTT